MPTPLVLPVRCAAIPPPTQKGAGRNFEGSREPEPNQARGGEETPEQVSVAVWSGVPRICNGDGWHCRRFVRKYSAVFDMSFPVAASVPGSRSATSPCVLHTLVFRDTRFVTLELRKTLLLFPSHRRRAARA